MTKLKALLGLLQLALPASALFPGHRGHHGALHQHDKRAKDTITIAYTTVVTIHQTHAGKTVTQTVTAAAETITQYKGKGGQGANTVTVTVAGAGCNSNSTSPDDQSDQCNGEASVTSNTNSVFCQYYAGSQVSNSFQADQTTTFDGSLSDSDAIQQCADYISSLSGEAGTFQVYYVPSENQWHCDSSQNMDDDSNWTGNDNIGSIYQYDSPGSSGSSASSTVPSDGSAASSTIPSDNGSAASSTVPSDDGSAASSTIPSDDGSAASSTIPSDDGSAASSTIPSDDGSAASTTLPDDGSAASTTLPSDDGSAASTTLSSGDGSAASTTLASGDGSAATTTLASGSGSAESTTVSPDSESAAATSSVSSGSGSAAASSSVSSGPGSAAASSSVSSGPGSAAASSSVSSSSGKKSKTKSASSASVAPDSQSAATSTTMSATASGTSSASSTRAGRISSTLSSTSTRSASATSSASASAQCTNGEASVTSNTGATFCEFYAGKNVRNSYKYYSTTFFPSTTSDTDAIQECANYISSLSGVAGTFQVFYVPSEKRWHCDSSQNFNDDTTWDANTGIAEIYQYDIAGHVQASSGSSSATGSKASSMTGSGSPTGSSSSSGIKAASSTGSATGSTKSGKSATSTKSASSATTPSASSAAGCNGQVSVNSNTNEVFCQYYAGKGVRNTFTYYTTTFFPSTTSDSDAIQQCANYISSLGNGVAGTFQVFYVPSEKRWHCDSSQQYNDNTDWAANSGIEEIYQYDAMGHPAAPSKASSTVQSPTPSATPSKSTKASTKAQSTTPSGTPSASSAAGCNGKASVNSNTNQVFCQFYAGSGVRSSYKYYTTTFFPSGTSSSDAIQQCANYISSLGSSVAGTFQVFYNPSEGRWHCDSSQGNFNQVDWTANSGVSSIFQYDTPAALASSATAYSTTPSATPSASPKASTKATTPSASSKSVTPSATPSADRSSQCNGKATVFSNTNEAFCQFYAGSGVRSSYQYYTTTFFPSGTSDSDAIQQCANYISSLGNSAAGTFQVFYNPTEKRWHCDSSQGNFNQVDWTANSGVNQIYQYDTPSALSSGATKPLSTTHSTTAAAATTPSMTRATPATTASATPSAGGCPSGKASVNSNTNEVFCEFYQGSGVRSSYQYYSTTFFPSGTTDAQAIQQCANYISSLGNSVAGTFQVFYNPTEQRWHCDSSQGNFNQVDWTANSGVKQMYQYDTPSALSSAATKPSTTMSTTRATTPATTAAAASTTRAATTRSATPSAVAGCNGYSGFFNSANQLLCQVLSGSNQRSSGNWYTIATYGSGVSDSQAQQQCANAVQGAFELIYVTSSGQWHCNSQTGTASQLDKTASSSCGQVYQYNPAAGKSSSTTPKPAATASAAGCGSKTSITSNTSEQFCEFWAGSGKRNSFKYYSTSFFPSGTTDQSAIQQCANYISSLGNKVAGTFQVFYVPSEKQWHCDSSQTMNTDSNFQANSGVNQMYQFNVAGS